MFAQKYFSTNILPTDFNYHEYLSNLMPSNFRLDICHILIYLVAFYLTMMVLGVCRGLHLSSMVGVCMEITTPAQAVLVFMMESVAEGIGCVTLPYLAGKYLPTVSQNNCIIYLYGVTSLIKILVKNGKTKSFLASPNKLLNLEFMQKRKLTF